MPPAAALLRHPPTPPPPAVAVAAADTCELQNESYVSSVVVAVALCMPNVPAPAAPPRGGGAVGMSKVFWDVRKEEEDDTGGGGTGVGVRRAGVRCEGGEGVGAGTEAGEGGG